MIRLLWLLVSKGVFLVRFATVEASLQVTTEGYQFFDQKPLITRIWDPDMSMEKTNDNVRIWIKMPGLPIKYWGERSLFKIAGLVGRAVKMDMATKSKDRLSYARVMVEVPMKQQLPGTISFYNEHGKIVEQKLEYEWLPVVCKKCSGVGHNEEDCRKGVGKKIWVSKKKLVIDQDGFQQVGSKTTQQVQVDEVPINNPFNALLDDMVEVCRDDEEDEVAGERVRNEVSMQSKEVMGVKGHGLITPIPNG